MTGRTPMSATAVYWAERALLPGGVAHDVTLECDGGVLTAVTHATRRPPRAVASAASCSPAWSTPTRTPSTAPCGGGRPAATSGRGGPACTRWSSGSTPTRCSPWPPRSFGELLLAGITTVHEFHYLHHPAGMDDAVCEAAAARRHPARAARHVLPARRLRRRSARPRAAAVLRRLRRAVGGAGRVGRRRQRRRHRWRPPSTASGPSTQRSMAAVAAWARGARLCPCTCTCPSNPPRTTRASRRPG